MSLGLYLAIAAVVCWLALGIAGERAPHLIWSAPWIAVALFGLLLQHFAYWACGKELT